MGTLFPLYFLGALAIAIPIALHLRRRPPKDRVVFSSLMFLDPQTPQRKRRNKLENWFLLLLRCLALLLLTLLFARPYLRDQNAVIELAPGVTRVLLLDTSASMQRDGLWKTANEHVDKILTEAKPDDRFAILAFDSESQQLLSFEAWKDLPFPQRRPTAESLISDLAPGWSSTSLDSALVEAVGLIEDETKGAPGNKQIIVVSDFQEGGDRSGLENFAWPEDIELRMLSIAPKKNGNAAVHLVARIETEDDDEIDAAELLGQARALRVRVTNAADATKENFTLGWDGDSANAIDILLPPGATRVVSAPPRPESGGDFLELSGDTELFDNRVFVAPLQARPVSLMFVGESTDANDTRSPLYYLWRALSPTETLEPMIQARPAAAVARDELLATDVVVLAAKLPKETEVFMEQYLQAGGVAFLPLWSSREAPAFLSQAGIETTEAEVADYAMLEQIDYEHPILRPFAAPGLRDFTKIHFWKYRKLTLTEPESENIRVLASYDSGDPALLELRVGKGRVFVFTSNWTPNESQIALSTKFVPLIYSILRVAGFESDAKRQFYVGDPIPVFHDDAVVTHPDKTITTGPTRSTLPGVYNVEYEGEQLTHAVNTPFAESRLDPVLPESFTEFGITLARDGSIADAELSPEDRARLEGTELEDRQKLWKWIVLAVLGFLVLETWLANRPAKAEPIAA
ncbi:MAG: Mg-chelatase subunit ChlD [Verrucomicrobiales bacterium]|jgi:Mg-chelatase subunit ChlD